MVEFDDILKDLGDFGRYQKMVYFSICLLAIPCSWHTLGNTYLSATPRHYCRVSASTAGDGGSEDSDYEPDGYADDSKFKTCTIPRRSSGGGGYYDYEWDSCRRYSNISTPYDCTEGEDREVMGCDEGWVYDTTYYGSTAVSQWNLVCHKKSQRQLSRSLVMVGKMIGSAVFGQLADFFGRKTMLLFGLLLQSCVGVGAAFSPNFPVFCVMQFLLGMTSSGIFVAAFVIGTELVGPSKRAFAGIVIRIFYSIGMMLLAVIAWYLREWPKIELAISLPPILFLSYYWIVPESPRWLMSQGRTEEADTILMRAAEVNKVTLSAFEKRRNKNDLQQPPTRPTLRRRYSAIDLVRTPNMRIKTIKIYFNWISSSMAYYGLSFLTEDLGSDPYLAFFISGAVEIPAYIICLLLLDRIGRKWLTSVFMVIGGAALLCALPVPNEYEVTTLSIAMIGKFCISGSYAIVYLYAAELFPTPIRNAGVGMGSFSSRIGSILAPQILILGDLFSPVVPLAIFGGLAFIAGLLVLLLPETLNKKLPETIEEGEAFGQGKSLWRRVTGQSSKPKIASLSDLPEVFDDAAAHVPVKNISAAKLVSLAATDMAVQTCEADFALDNLGLYI